jgi:hypothetical protein
MQVATALIVSLIPLPASAADSVAPQVISFGPVEQIVNLSAGQNYFRIAGNVFDETGVDYIQFHCRDSRTGISNYGAAISFSKSFPQGFVATSAGIVFNSNMVIFKSISGSSRQFSFEIAGKVPAGSLASKCTWDSFSADSEGNSNSGVKLNAALEIIAMDGTRVTPPIATPSPSPSLTPSPNPTESPSPNLGDEEQVSVAFRDPFWIIKVSKAKGKTLTLKTLLHKKQIRILSDDEDFQQTAFVGASLEVRIDGKVIQSLQTPEGFGVNDQSAISHAIWSGQQLKASGRVNDPNSSVEIVIGSSAAIPVIQPDRNWALARKVPTPSISKIYVDQKLQFTLPVSSAFVTCSKLWTTFEGGVSRSLATKNVGPKTKFLPTFYTEGYSRNKKLDLDNDGIACER